MPCHTLQPVAFLSSSPPALINNARTLSMSPQALHSQQRCAVVSDASCKRCIKENRQNGLSLTIIAALHPSALCTPWRPAPCPHCGCLLMLSKRLTLTWCCNNSAKLLGHLPPLPAQIPQLIAASCNNVLACSQELNSLSHSAPLVSLIQVGPSTRVSCQFHVLPILFV